MKNRIPLAAALLLTLASLTLPATALGRPTYHHSIGKAMGLVPQVNTPDPAVGSNVPGVYHGGSVMDTGNVTIHTIFWAPSGYQYGGSPSAGAPDYKTLIQQFFTDIAHDSGSSTNIFSLLDQYGDNSGPGKYSIAYNAATDSIDDTDPYPSSSAQCPSPSGTSTCVTDQEVSNEIAHIIQTTDPAGYGTHDIWELFLPQNVDECIIVGECGTNAFGAYHSLADAGHGTFIYALMIDVGIEVNPIPQSDPEGNAEAEATIDSAAHETFEAMTDPEGVGWMDPNGYELADKCEFGPQLGDILGYAPNGQPYNQVIDGHQYAIQDMWSNDQGGCESQSTDTADGLPLNQVDLNQFKPDVSGQLGSATGGIPVHVTLLRAGAPVAQGSATTNSGGAWGPVRLTGPHGASHATGDDRDVVVIDYGNRGPAPDLIATGAGGDPFSESGYMGWLDMDTGVDLTSNSITVSPCFQVGVLEARIGSQTESLTPECGTGTGTASVATPTISGATPVSYTSNDNRAPSPANPLGDMVSLTVPVGEPDSVSAIGNENVPFDPTGTPACTAELRLQAAKCSGLVPGARYTLTRGRGHLVRQAKADGDGVAGFAGFGVRGGDVLTLTNSARRVLTTLHVAHLRVAITGNENVIASGTCQAGDYMGRPLTSLPASSAVGFGGAAGNGTICPSSGKAKGLSAASLEQVDDLSGGVTSTSVPVLTGEAPANDAIVPARFRALAQTGVVAANRKVEPTGAKVSLTIDRGHRKVFHAGNVANGHSVAVGPLASGVYTATWKVIDGNGDTRTVVTKFVAQ